MRVRGSDGPEAGRGVLQGAFLLLEALRHEGEAGLTLLATRAGLPKATAHRLLDQLVTLGAVRRRAGRYQIGPKMFLLGQAWSPAPLLRAARGPLRQLSSALEGLSVCMGVPDTAGSVLVASLRGEVDDVVPLSPGFTLPPGCPADKVFATQSLVNANLARIPRMRPGRIG